MLLRTELLRSKRQLIVSKAWQKGLSEGERKQLAIAIIGKSILSRSNDQSVNVPMIVSSVLVIGAAMFALVLIVNSAAGRSQRRASMISKVDIGIMPPTPTDINFSQGYGVGQVWKTPEMEKVTKVDELLIRDEVVSEIRLSSTKIVSDQLKLTAGSTAIVEPLRVRGNLAKVSSNSAIKITLPWQLDHHKRPDLPQDCQAICGYEGITVTVLCGWEWWNGRGGEWALDCKTQ